MKEKKDKALFLLRLDSEQRKQVRLQAINLNVTMSEVIMYYLTNNKKLGDKIEL
jgi:hypothetical protein